MTTIPDHPSDQHPSSASSKEALRILVVRCDRLGDVILSTPVFDVIKRHYPHSYLTVMVQASVAPLLRGLPSVDEVMIYEPNGRHRGIGGLWRLIGDIRNGGHRISVVLQSQWKIALAIFLAAVRYRIGPLSKFYSFVLYNRGVRQHRSQVEMHETDYNLQLLRRLGIRVGTRNVPVSVHLGEKPQAWARAWLLEKGWDPTHQLIAVHPGMGGSALNWPESHYAELIRVLIREGKQVLLTGGPTEGALLRRIQESLGVLKEKVWTYGGEQAGSIENLAALFELSSVVVAPSTGPMHLAVAVGRRVVTFYPPIRVQSAIRWGPYLPDETRASILVPEVYCGQDFKCRGPLCNYYPCMKGLTVNEAVEKVSQQLSLVERLQQPAISVKTEEYETV